MKSRFIKSILDETENPYTGKLTLMVDLSCLHDSKQSPYFMRNKHPTMSLLAWLFVNNKLPVEVYKCLTPVGRLAFEDLVETSRFLEPYGEFNIGPVFPKWVAVYTT